MPDEAQYTSDQIATAARELRQAAGADEEIFTTAQAINRLDEEIRLLRERGFTDERIAGLLSGFDIIVTPEQLSEYSPTTL